MEIFEVGGCVRDELLGIESDDIDFTVVIGETKNKSVDQGWSEMLSWLNDQGFKIFLETKECFTVRAKFPKGHKREGLVADFVMARKEVGVIDGTRKPILELGTLEDDLRRRDFTMNAIAKDSEGRFIDPFGGISDIERNLIRTPLPRALDTLLDDPLRMIRAIRFSITKGFDIDDFIVHHMFSKEVISKLRQVVSQERIQVEVTKMMKFDSIKTIKVLSEMPESLLKIIFSNGMWLMPTTKKK